MAVFAISLTAAPPSSPHSAGQTVLRCAMTRVVNRLTTCASNASRCSLRSFSISRQGSRRFFQLKSVQLQRFAGQRKLYARFRSFSLHHEKLDGSEESGQLSRIAHRQKISQNSRVVIPKKHRALVG